MTLVEFVDKNATENIAAIINLKPERLILIGKDRELAEACVRRYSRITEKRGLFVGYGTRVCDTGDLSKTVSVLVEIVNAYPDVAFDITGGENAAVAAMGIVSERYSQRLIPLHNFSFSENSISDKFRGVKLNAPKLSAEENVISYGGKIVYEEEKSCATHRLVISDELFSDIEAVWRICKSSPKSWNTYIEALNSGKDTDIRITDELESFGVVKNGKYRSPETKRLFSKAGQILEMKIFKEIYELPEYNDVINGAYIDWDGEVHLKRGNHDIENEIDVLAMSGMTPVFISCKNGFVDMNELYKLYTVAENFGGKYAKKVLIISSIDVAKDNTAYFFSRAEAMGIKIISNLYDMADEELKETVKKII